MHQCKKESFRIRRNGPLNGGDEAVSIIEKKKKYFSKNNIEKNTDAQKIKNLLKYSENKKQNQQKQKRHKKWIGTISFCLDIVYVYMYTIYILLVTRCQSK